MTQLLPNSAEKRLRVLMITEGTYPFHWGGVSTWCHLLLRDLPNIDFELFSLAASPDLEPQFSLPTNVVAFHHIPLWGIREVLENRPALSMAELYRRKRSTTNQVIEQQFIPLFRIFVQELFVKTLPIQQLGRLIHAMHRFFLEYDFDTAMRSPAVWRCFVTAAQTGFPHLADKNGYPTAAFHLADMSTAMQWLYHWLFPIGAPLPKVDVAHAAMVGISTLIAVVEKYEHGAAIMLTEHGIYLRERYLAEAASENSLFLKIFSLCFARRMTELTYALADQISPCCDANQRWELRNGAKRQQIRTIYYGVDSNTFTPESKPFGDPPVVVWVGRIDPLKDLLTLIRAAGVVHQSRPDIEFRLFGSTPAGNEAYYEQCLELRRELGLEQTVIFAGFRASTVSAFNEGDIVVLSSISEAFPFVVLEAMLCEKPVVATGVGGVPEQITGCGFAIEPRNPEAMAEAILKLMGDPELCATLGKAARAKAMSEFSVQQSGRAHEESYQRLVKKQQSLAAQARNRQQARPHLLQQQVLLIQQALNMAKNGVDSHNYSSNGQQTNGHQTNGQHINGQHINGQHINGQHINGQHINGQHINGQHINGQHINGQHSNGQHSNGQHNNGQQTNGRRSYQRLPLLLERANAVRVMGKQRLQQAAPQHSASGNGANGNGAYHAPIDSPHADAPVAVVDSHTTDTTLWGNSYLKNSFQTLPNHKTKGLRQEENGSHSPVPMILPMSALNGNGHKGQPKPQTNGHHASAMAHMARPQWQAENAQTIAALAMEVAQRDRQPIDALEITAIIESTGITDEVAVQRYGAPNAFELGEALFAQIKMTGQPSPIWKPQPTPPTTWRETLRDLARGPLALLPALILLFCIFAYSAIGKWDSNRVLVLSAGMTVSMLLTNGFIQAISRRTSIFLGLGKRLAAGQFLWRSTFVVGAILLGVVVLAAVATARIGLLTTAECLIFTAAFLGLSALWLAAGGLSLVQRADWLVVAMLSGLIAGIATDWVATYFFGWRLIAGTIIGYSVTMFLIIRALQRGYTDNQADKKVDKETDKTKRKLHLPSLLLIVRSLWRGDADNQPDQEADKAKKKLRLPSLAYMLHEAAPLFVYGLLYMAFILLPHILGWLGALGVHQVRAWAVTSVEVGLTVSMPPIIIANGVAEYTLRRFWRYAPALQTRTPAKELYQFQNALVKFYWQYAAIYLATLVIWSVATQIFFQMAIDAGWIEAWLGPVDMVQPLFIFHAGLIAYGLVGLGVFSCMFCITLNAPQLALRAVLWGMITTILVGIPLSNWHYTYSSLAFICGAFVFVLVAWRMCHQVLRSSDYRFAMAL